MSIARLRRESDAARTRLVKQMSDEKTGNRKGDDRFWTPTFDEEKKTGSATIRFLPAPDGEAIDYVRVFDHAFKNEKTNKWYIENSRTSIDEADPVGEMNHRLWNSGNKADQDIARKFKRRKNYIGGIYIVNDPSKPENNGKVKLYKMPVAIYEKTQMALSPQFEGEVSFNPFDFWKGANLEIRIRIKDDYRNYEMSKWSNNSELFPGDDEKKEAIWKQCHSLEAFLAPSNYKTYEELQKKLLEVLGERVGAGLDGQGVEVVVGGSTTVKSTPKAQEPRKAEASAPVETPATPQVAKEAPVAAAVKTPPAASEGPGLDDFDSWLNDLEVQK